MRKMLIIMLAACLMVFYAIGGARAQATLRGRITDVETGKPLEGTNVYLSGTIMGMGANAEGTYHIRGIPAGGYRLVVSHVGYATKITSIMIGSGKSKKMDFELEPVIYELPESFVGNYDKHWKKNLKRFTRYFIGETKWADSVKILNPEVLRFDKKWWGRLSAKALASLKIENRALGYRITYHLTQFSHSGDRTRWDGEPLFTKMTPADSAQAAYWERNRRQAFYGSIRHFLLALLADRLKEEGFVLYRQRRGVRSYAPRNKRRTSGQRFIKEGVAPYLHRLNFFGRLEIIYTREKEDRHYRRWLNQWQQRSRGAQTSYLKLDEHPVTVDKNGEIIQPYGATQFGYFSYSRLADLTPRKYRPEDYETVK